ncbi:unnamed protein product [Symbiodinium natans]|uniref:Protein kinase domain-containing protein n=1 Tax=Symbiodinium natans TaxID=878477 RepID=A0A812IM74_9DINO|nr:unnamed protein product [Symbiodinium natans]
MALTRLRGEQLDGWLQRSAEVSGESSQRPWTDALRGGCILARHLLQQLGPTLQSLAPLAWHRDVNSHNVLICNESSEDGTLSLDDGEDKASFWLCDLGLAVDSQSWTGEENLWRVTDIGGDCRYWPASCWMVHCFGADYLEQRPNFCRQYKSRLDIHALGITAIEVLCTKALALRTAGASAGEIPSCWSSLLDAWKQYHETVSDWWQAIYTVFSAGGDFRPVHAWLVEIAAPDKVVSLVGNMRQALKDCADCSDEAVAQLLHAVAAATDEDSQLELLDICKMAGEEIERPVASAGQAPMTEAKQDPSSTAAADVAAGTQDSATAQEESRGKVARPEQCAINGSKSTKALRVKLEEEHARLSGDLQKLQLHRQRVLLARSMLSQLP